MSTQQDIYAAGSESRPPMLHKENYVPWSSRLLRYAKSRPNGKLIHNSILNGPYVRRMIPEPGDANRDVNVPETFHEQTDDELSERELKQIEADDQAIQTILLGLPEDIYVAVDICETAQETWLRVQQMMKGSDIGIQEKKARALWYPKDSSIALTAYADADHAGCQDTRQSTSGRSDDETPPPPPQTPTQQTSHTVSNIKLPIMKKYTNGQIKVLPPKIAKEILASKRERKARTTLLMAITEDHLAKFHKIIDTKEMWESIKSRFCGNDESKKMQKYILKQLFESFFVSNSEGLHKVSLIMRTKPGVDTLSFDDLYDNLRVFKSDVKGFTASSFSTQNVAFISSESTSSTNEASTAYGVSTSSGHNSHRESSSSDTDELMYSFFAKSIQWSSDIEDSLVNDRYAKGIKSDAETSNSTSCESNSSVETLESIPKPVANEPKAVSEPKVWSNAPFIEEYKSNSNDEHVTIPLKEQEKPSFAFVNTVKHVKTPIKEQNTCSQNPKPNKRDWNGLMSKKLGLGYGFTKKACFVCGSFSHLIRDCDFHKKRMAKQDDPQKALKNKEIVDSGCSRHMTRNKAYLVNYQDYNRGPIAFGGSKGHITREVSTACFVLNRVLVTKPQNKTPYELITSKIPIISYIRPFGCHVTILNTIDHLGKFDGKSDEGSEIQANKTIGPKEANHSAGTQDTIDTGYSKKEVEPAQEYYVLPLWSSYTSTIKSSEAKNRGEKSKKDTGLKSNEKPVDQEEQAFLEDERLKRQEKEANDEVEALRKEDPTLAVQTRSKVKKSSGAHAFDLFGLCFFMGFIVYQMDAKSTFLYGTINEEVYVTQTLCFVDLKYPQKIKRGTIDKTLLIKKDKKDIMLDKYVAEILKKFDFMIVKTANTPIETKKPLTKDEEAADVDVHLYRSMIGFLMYLTASRPDIMFAVCACSRFQVTPKTLHLQAMKNIFSDYAEANLDRKSTTGGCQFLGRRLISWRFKKQTIVATSTTEVEYVAAANCCGQVLWIQNQMLDYGFNFMNTKIYIDNENTICIVKNPVFHSKTKHIAIRHHLIKDAYEKKLIQVLKIHTDENVADLLTKSFDVS
nr:putative ribonuclease H-like domain-containing protein [Tanacetum cinerariifolium]